MEQKHQTEIRLIDLSKAEDDLVREIRSACVEVGFFYVTNHGVDAEIISRFYDVMRAFFRLGHDHKMKIPSDENFRGYYPFAAQTLDTSKLQKQPDTKEGFYCGLEVPAESAHSQFPLIGPNQWPVQCPEFEKAVMDYLHALTPVANRVLELLALSLGCARDRFTHLYSTPVSRLKLNHYNKIKSDTEKGIFAGGAHTDWGVITLLTTDGVKGLQVFRQSQSEWQDVANVYGSFVVNLGNIMQRWTNDLYKSTLHRVVNMSGQDRYSATFFYDPDYMTPIKCLPQCCSDENGAKYKEGTLGGLLVENFNATFGTNIHDASSTATSAL